MQKRKNSLSELLWKIKLLNQRRAGWGACCSFTNTLLSFSHHTINMDTEELIRQLKASAPYAECPDCGGTFKLSSAILFDGTKPFPDKALSVQERLKNEFKEQIENFKKQKKLVTEKSAITAEAVNIGKSLEKILPTLKDFRWEPSDSRFLGNPIDLLTFNGLSRGKVDSISFIEVKSGNAHLNGHQKSIKKAIEDKNVEYKVF